MQECAYNIICLLWWQVYLLYYRIIFFMSCTHGIPNCIVNMVEIYCRLLKIRIPLLVIMAVSYLVEWGYKFLHHYGMCQPQVLTPARIKYLTVHRTFSCNKAAEELGYKPIVTLMVHCFNSLCDFVLHSWFFFFFC